MQVCREHFSFHWQVSVFSDLSEDSILLTFVILLYLVFIWRDGRERSCGRGRTKRKLGSELPLEIKCIPVAFEKKGRRKLVKNDIPITSQRGREEHIIPQRKLLDWCWCIYFQSQCKICFFFFFRKRNNLFIGPFILVHFCVRVCLSEIATRKTKKNLMCMKSIALG